MNELWCEYPGCQDVRTIRRGQRFCAYHELVLNNASDELFGETMRTIEFRRRAKAATEKRAARMPPAIRSAVFDFMKTSPKKNGAELKSAPRNQVIPTVTPNPLGGKSFTVEVDHDQLRGSETNPRKDFREDKLRELADSLKANGQLQACLVRPDPKWLAAALKTAKFKTPSYKVGVEILAGKLEVNRELTAKEVAAVEEVVKDPRACFEIVAGERRWRAAAPKFAALKKVLVTVRFLSDAQVIDAQYVENLQRDDLTALEEAGGFAKLIEMKLHTPDSLAQKLGKSRTYVFERLKLLKLEGPAKKALEQGQITPSVAAVIAQVPGKDAQEELLEDECFDYAGKMRSVREIEQSIERRFMRALKGVAWNIDQPMNVPGFWLDALRDLFS